MRIIEIFRSIQGESSTVGTPCTFVRTAGCNLNCYWCDTRYAMEAGIEMSVLEILGQVRQFNTKLVCITGGEPFLQRDLHELVNALQSAGYQIQIMTNGTVFFGLMNSQVSRVIDIKSPWVLEPDVPKELESLQLSPVGLELSNLKLLSPSDEIKFVARNLVEFQWFLAWAKSVDLFGKGVAVAVGPAWGILDPGLLVDWILESGLPIRLNLQIHKIIWGSETRR